MVIPTTKQNISVFIASVFLFSVLLTSCYYDNEEELYPGSLDCDTTAVTYSGTIVPIMQEQCNSCHNLSNASGGVVTDSYYYLIVTVNNGTFWGTINHDKGYPDMPRNSPKLSYCELTRIKAWIDGGAPNN